MKELSPNLWMWNGFVIFLSKIYIQQILSCNIYYLCMTFCNNEIFAVNLLRLVLVLLSFYDNHYFKIKTSSRQYSLFFVPRETGWVAKWTSQCTGRWMSRFKPGQVHALLSGFNCFVILDAVGNLERKCPVCKEPVK